MNHGVWVVWVANDARPNTNAYLTTPQTSYRMCARCGYTQWTDVDQAAWVEMEGSVVGVSCIDQPPDPNRIGYTTPTP